MEDKSALEEVVADSLKPIAGEIYLSLPVIVYDLQWDENATRLIVLFPGSPSLVNVLQGLEHCYL